MSISLFVLALLFVATLFNTGISVYNLLKGRYLAMLINLVTATVAGAFMFQQFFDIVFYS